MYKQLTEEKRFLLEFLLNQGKKKQEIATLLEVHKSTVYRELKRNIPLRGRGAFVYKSRIAQNKTHKRHKEKLKKIKLTQEMIERIIYWLSIEHLSPELIAYKLKKEFSESVSHETIYKWIWKSKHSNHRNFVKFKALYLYLKHGKRRRKRGNYKDSRGIITNKVCITERPQVVRTRKRIGDLEVDLMMGKDHKSALLVITDRATLTTGLEKLNSKNEKEVTQKIIKKLSKFSSSWVKTLTFDNGKEFAGHQEIANHFNAKTYFTRPYTSQDKGTVENRIGVIRRFLPKKTDLNLISSQRIKEIEYFINNRPVRKFNYLSPIEKLYKSVALIS